MSDPADRQTPEAPETPEQRKRRLAKVFGDVLPDTTSDERDHDATSGSAESASDSWLKSQVPPHHG